MATPPCRWLSSTISAAGSRQEIASVDSDRDYVPAWGDHKQKPEAPWRLAEKEKIDGAGKDTAARWRQTIARAAISTSGTKVAVIMPPVGIRTLRRPETAKEIVQPRNNASNSGRFHAEDGGADLTRWP
jgi:hypothetical protein